MSFDVQMVSGDTKILNITAKTSSGTAINLTGVAIIWSLFPSTGGTALLTKSVGSGISITDPSNGVFQVTLNPTDTASLEGLYQHEAQITDVTNNIQTLRSSENLRPGRFEIVGDLIT